LPAFDNKSETEKMLKAIDARAGASGENSMSMFANWEKKGAKATEAQLKSRGG
jgi:hypothetical protein